MTPDLKALMEFEGRPPAEQDTYGRGHYSGKEFENARLRPILDYLMRDRERLREALTEVRDSTDDMHWEIALCALLTSDEGLKKLLEGK